MTIRKLLLTTSIAMIPVLGLAQGQAPAQGPAAATGPLTRSMRPSPSACC